MIILGTRAHDFGKLPVEELAQKIAEDGVSCVQLALSKAIGGIDTELNRLSPGLANYIGETFHRHHIKIAILGCYVNLIHPDLDTRKNLLNRFKEHLRFARDFGCSIVATETGSVNADYSFHPDNHGEVAFQTLLKSVTELAEEAEKFGVLACIEGVSQHVANSPQRIKRVLDIIPSNNLQVIFDPVNFLSTENYQEQDRIISESFDLFGDKMMSLHAKDFKIEGDQLITAPAGKGQLNYTLLFKLLKIHKPYIYTVLEDTKPEMLAESMSFIRNIYLQV